MLKKDRYWIVKDSEMDIIATLLKSHPSFQKLQEGSMVNALFNDMNKALAEKQAAEQQPIEQELDTEPVYQNQGRNIPEGQTMHPPRRGVAAKVSQTQPPVPPMPQKKKPLIQRKPTPEELNEESQEYEEGEEDDTVDQDELMSDFTDSDF